MRQGDKMNDFQNAADRKKSPFAFLFLSSVAAQLFLSTSLIAQPSTCEHLIKQFEWKFTGHSPSPTFLQKVLDPTLAFMIKAGLETPRRIKLSLRSTFRTTPTDHPSYRPLSRELRLATHQVIWADFNGEIERGRRLYATSIHELVHTFVEDHLMSRVPALRRSRKFELQNSKFKDWVYAGFYSLRAGHPAFQSRIALSRRDLRAHENAWLKAENEIRRGFSDWIFTGYNELLADLGAVLILNDPSIVSLPASNAYIARSIRDFSAQITLEDLPDQSMNKTGRVRFIQNPNGRDLPRGVSIQESPANKNEVSAQHNQFDFIRTKLWRIYQEIPDFKRSPELLFRFSLDCVAEALNHRARDKDGWKWSVRKMNAELERIIDMRLREKHFNGESAENLTEKKTSK